MHRLQLNLVVTNVRKIAWPLSFVASPTGFTRGLGKKTNLDDRSSSRTGDLNSVIVIGLALIALTLKLAIAYNTIGTNDAVIFYGFAKVLSQHSLEWTYQHSIYFNHPPLTAYYLRTIFWISEQGWCQQIGVHFPFLLRLPGIIADFVLVLVLIRMSKLHCDLRIPRWALALFALNPVSLMISGFHGNTDPVMALFLVCAGFMCLQGRPAICGLFLALSCQIKIVPILFLPAFVFFWLPQRKIRAFLLSLVSLSAVLWSEPLLKFPALFFKNVMSYGSYWGIWGVTYCLRLTGLREFSKVSFFDLAPAQIVVIVILKIVIVAAALVIAWRRRQLRGRAFINSLAYTWIAFFLFSPGVCAQYLIWLLPFVLVLSPALCSYLVLGSSVFLFAFYNITAGGLPWSVAISTDDVRELWAPWSLLPWSILIAGTIVIWRKTARGKAAFRFFTFEALRAEN